MSKSSKGKKNKVPKLTEAEYASYISSLKSPDETLPKPQTDEKTDSEQTVQPE